MQTLNQQVTDIQIVPVIAIKDAPKAVKLAQVLIENGLPCAEIAFRSN